MHYGSDRSGCAGDGQVRAIRANSAVRSSKVSEFGYLEGSFSGSIADYLYFSFAAFTAVGFGDNVPLGPLRLLAGMEALTGFVLITWTASYLYIEMSRTWGVED